tara:strand:- start:284 stop:982 length:699 start_codon:yes stop_codon:yes gene_type:complete
MKKNLIFTATYNEIENIGKLIKKINQLSKNVDILIIDDNSPDGTGLLVKKLKKKYSNLKLIERVKKSGLNTAHQIGFRYAKKNNYKKLITMDADLSHNPKEIPKILKLLDKNEFVIGSRYMKGGKCEMKLHRLVLSIIGNKIIKFILNINSDEFTSSYRGFNLEKLKRFDLKYIKSKGYSFFMESVFLINSLNYKILQIPITFSNRKHGQSKIPKDEIFRTLKNLFILKYLK